MSTASPHRAKAFPVPTKKSRSQLFISLFFLGLSKEPVSLQQLWLQTFALFFSPDDGAVGWVTAFIRCRCSSPSLGCSLRGQAVPSAAREQRAWGLLWKGLFWVRHRGLRSRDQRAGGRATGSDRNCSPNLPQGSVPQKQRQAAAPALKCPLS